MSNGKRILIIDDTDLINHALAQHLHRTEDYSCVCEISSEKGQETALNACFDLIIIDVSTGNLTPTEICSRLRQQDVVAPIMVIMSTEDDPAAIKMLDSGATDCIVKPFKLGVLMARIRAHIRQFEHSDEALLKIGRFLFSVGRKTLRPEDGKTPTLRLTDKEGQILKYLYLHSDRLIDRDELLGEVWGYTAGVTTHTLETHVYRLRQKLEEHPSHATILVTEPGGYRLLPLG